MAHQRPRRKATGVRNNRVPRTGETLEASSDDDLIRLAKQHASEAQSTDALAELYKRHHGWVLEIALKYAYGNEALAWDIFGDTWEVVIREIREYPCGTPFREKLCEIAKDSKNEQWPPKGLTSLDQVHEFLFLLAPSLFTEEESDTNQGQELPKTPWTDPECIKLMRDILRGKVKPKNGKPLDRLDELILRRLYSPDPPTKAELARELDGVKPGTLRQWTRRALITIRTCFEERGLP